ncbi:hypothetical protein H0G86_008586 [Trichoderma simmonsii]|uniref:Uncharacterized protein n=1 Tax=Trichoderma simmonsii TaxID=1491479 RepID=A0A8G0PJG5_9HYPO|nr:hypothetical protein H0G86_008586 [Trichoderma simmonsii]
MYPMPGALDGDRGARPLRRTARAQRASPGTGTREQSTGSPELRAELQLHSFLRARSGCRCGGQGQKRKGKGKIGSLENEQSSPHQTIANDGNQRLDVVHVQPSGLRSKRQVKL